MQVVRQTRTDANDIITVAELKRHLRVTHSLEDNLIEGIRAAAINYVENFANLFLGSDTAYGYLTRFESAYFPVGPVTAVEKIEFETDNAGTLSTMPSADYHLDLKSKVARVAFSDYPTPYEYALNPIRITFTAGHPEDGIPGAIMQAIKLICGHLYDHRHSEITGTIATSIKLGVDALLSGERITYQP